MGLELRVGPKTRTCLWTEFSTRLMIFFLSIKPVPSSQKEDQTLSLLQYIWGIHSRGHGALRTSSLFCKYPLSRTLLLTYIYLEFTETLGSVISGSILQRHGFERVFPITVREGRRYYWTLTKSERFKKDLGTVFCRRGLCCGSTLKEFL